MAKLSRGNLAAQKSAPTSKVDDWNPPIATSAAATPALMLPPKSRPLPKVPVTPSQKSMTNSDRQDSSSKKKRRRRGGKRNGDSASEVTTNLSEDVATDATTSTHEVSEVLVPASQSSGSALPPNASAEEMRIFQNEPELYGVYASSDEGDEDEKMVKNSITTSAQKERSPAYSPSIVAGPHHSSAAHDRQEDSESFSAEELGKLQMGSDVVVLDENQIPDPKKLANGRFKCPVASDFDCTQSFAQAKGARRHASRHLNAEKFKCDQCGKGYSRRDTFERHLKSQHKSTAEGAGTGKVSRIHANHIQSNGVADNQKVQDDERSASPPGDASGTESAHTGVSIANGTSVKIDNAADGDDSLESSSQIAKLAVSSQKEHSLAQKKQSSKVNGDLKRKRASPQPSSAMKPEARKRMRREQNMPSLTFQYVNAPRRSHTASKSSNVPKIAESEYSDVEMSDADGQGQEAKLDTQSTVDAGAEQDQSTDVNMMDDEETEGPDREEASSSEETLSAGEDNDDGKGESEEDEEGPTDEDHEEDDLDEMEAPQSQLPVAISDLHKQRTKNSKDFSSRIQRQSSMDSFVQRSKSSTTSARASASGSRVTVNVPVRSRVQSKITPNIPTGVQMSTKDNVEHLTDSGKDDQLANGANFMSNSDKFAKLRNKGKGRARSEPSDAEIVDDEAEETSSEDRPRATTIARRTSSTVSRGTPRVRNRMLLQKGKKKATESDDSDGVENPKPKKQSKARNPARKTKNAGTEEHYDDQSETKHKPSASVASSTWREASKSGVTGKFTEKEIRILHTWRDSFCGQNKMTAYEFNEMMANTASISKLDWKYGDWITKADFMQQYYEQLPYRNRRSMIRFRERHFQNADSSPWTEAHDKELRQFVAELGTKWVEIAQLMGRTQDAVSQRWRHKLNYGEKPALMGDWTEDEVKRLDEEVVAFAQMKKTTPDDQSLHIPWTAISKKLGNGRTAQQCSNRWRISTSKRVDGKFVKVPHNDRIPGDKLQKPRTPSKMEQRLSGRIMPKTSKVYKSAERVEDSDEEDEKEEKDDKDDDADDESEDSQVDPKQEVDGAETEEEASTREEEKSEDNINDGGEEESDSEQSEEQTATDASSHKDLSAISPTQRPRTSNVKQNGKKKREIATSDGGSSSETGDADMISSSQLQSRSSSTQSQSQPPHSSLLPTSNTPAVSRNPLRRANDGHITPGNGLSLSQLHAGTQANSSAKRTTGRTNRTRVPDSILVENRPSPRLNLRRRRVGSSSPIMTPLSEGAGRSPGVDGEEGEESSSDDSSNEGAGTDFKSPASFVSARDTTINSNENRRGHSSDGTGTDSNSSEASDSESNESAQASRNTEQDSSSTFWQSVNQNLRKLTGLSQSQNQSQNGKGRLSLADVLRRGAAVEESESDDDNE